MLLSVFRTANSRQLFGALPRVTGWRLTGKRGGEHGQGRLKRFHPPRLQRPPLPMTKRLWRAARVQSFCRRDLHGRGPRRRRASSRPRPGSAVL